MSIDYRVRQSRKLNYANFIDLLERVATMPEQNIDTFVNHEQTEITRLKIAWFFPGNGSNFAAAEIFQTQPAFSRAIERCEDILRSYLLQPLFCVSAMELKNLSSVEKLRRDRCISFVIEYSLAQLWFAWGIKPQAIMGRGVGELVAATIAGTIELADALRLVAIQPLQTEEAASASLLRAIKQIRPQIPLITARKASPSKNVTPLYWTKYWQQPEIYENPLEVLSDYQLVLTMGTRIEAPNNRDTQYLFSYGCDSEASWQEMLQSLGALYVRGIEIDWSSWQTSDRRTAAAFWRILSHRSGRSYGNYHHRARD